MRRRRWCLVMETPGWRAIDLAGDGRQVEVTLDQEQPAVEAVRAAFQEMGYDGGDVLLALPSAICLTGRIPASQIPLGADDRTKLFLLEDSLPVAAEDVTADFMVGEAATFGVAVVTEPLQRMIEQLEAVGLNIQAIAPWSLLAAQEWVSKHPQCDVLVARTTSGFEVIEVAGGCVRGWSAASSEAELGWQLRAIAIELGRPRTVISDGMQPDDEGNQWIRPETSWEEAARTTARGILTGTLSSWIDLRRDQLAGNAPARALRGTIRTFQFTTALLLLALLGGVLWQGVRYGQAADELARRQQEVFRQVLPDQPIPAGIRSRLESERARLISQQESAAKVPGRESALLTLVRFLEGVPTSIRLKVNGLSLAGRQVNVRSEVRTPGDGSAFVQALREAGFTARNPRSLRSGDSYTVDFDAQLEARSRPATEGL